MIVDSGFLIFDRSLKPSFSAQQAHFNNQKSTILNRQSMQRSAVLQESQSFATTLGFQ